MPEPHHRRSRAIVYVDGFNLYYGALKGTPHRWLDLATLADLLLLLDHGLRSPAQPRWVHNPNVVGSNPSPLSGGRKRSGPLEFSGVFR